MPHFPEGAYHKGGAAAAPVLAELAREFYAPLLQIVAELRARGLSLRAIARELDARGVQTRFGCGGWSAMQVQRVLARANAAAASGPPAQSGAESARAPGDGPGE
jgi:hypothetical protein